jgi:hypothetical protein
MKLVFLLKLITRGGNSSDSRHEFPSTDPSCVAMGKYAQRHHRALGASSALARPD